MSNSSVLIVSPDSDTQKSLASLLVECGLSATPASTVSETEIVLRDGRASVIVCSEQLPDGGFTEILRLSKAEVRKVPVIVFSHLADWNGYLNIVRAGAFDYIRYPSARGEVERVVRNAQKHTLQERARTASAA
jgi:DNA-binding NtrC family response regulator